MVLFPAWGSHPAMRQSFLHALKRSSPVVLTMGLGGLVVIGTLFMVSRLWPQFGTSTSTPTPPTLTDGTTSQPSRVLLYSFQAAAMRRPALNRLALQGTVTEQQQARYVLAADAIRAGDGAVALRLLEGLENRYTLLAPYILSLRAQAQMLLQQQGQAQMLWKQIIEQYPQSGAAGDAYYALGKTEPRYWDTAISTLPAHPRTVDIAVERLKKTPRERALLLLVAQHGLHLKNYRTYLDRLQQKVEPPLPPQDWQTIGFGYWEKQQYKEAGTAYRRAPSTSRNAYRAARGLQLGKEDKAAIAAYERMIATFPKAAETPRALMRLADLTENDTQALAHLEQSIQLAKQLNRLEDAGDAFTRKIKRLKGTTATAVVEAQLLKDLGQTDAAATLRWQRAWESFQQQQLATARRWAQEIAQFNPESPLAPQALFWDGKWADQMGQTQDRQQRFQQLWQRYPDSYYGWRAANLSGLPVGDFLSLRTQSVRLDPPHSRLPLRAGSPALQELYALGEGKTAWETWQLEFKTRETPSLAEQLTDGLVRLEVGEYLDGLFMLGNLRDRLRTEPDLQTQHSSFASLHQDRRYWQALYPIPYWSEIQGWSSANEVNPVLTLALMRQESRFDPAIKSVAGATGLMQLMPETAENIAAQLKLTAYRLDQPSDNIRLGTWYLNSTHRTYQDNSMLAIASYNAGPGNVAEWLQTLDTRDTDRFIETIPFDETRTYVKAVLENYWNYLRLYSPQAIDPSRT